MLFLNLQMFSRALCLIFQSEINHKLQVQLFPFDGLKRDNVIFFIFP